MKLDHSQYRIWKGNGAHAWWHRLNPVSAIAQLYWGIRVPKTILITREINKTPVEKSRVPCPHCNTVHMGAKWMAPNETANKNWYGLYCDTCGGIIPCVNNIFASILLIISYPFWFWNKEARRQKWLKEQPERYNNQKEIVFGNFFWGNNWQIGGLTWALLACTFSKMFNWFTGESIFFSDYLIDIPVWVLAGFGYGYLMHAIMPKSKVIPV